jgi:hypothetical protein
MSRANGNTELDSRRFGIHEQPTLADEHQRHEGDREGERECERTQTLEPPTQATRAPRRSPPYRWHAQTFELST